MNEKNSLIELTADIVAAFVGNNSVALADMPSLISATYAALNGADAPPPPLLEAKSPAVAIKRSVLPDFIICLEDGQKFKSLKRHLRAKYNLTPDEYRAKWGLPKDYPMVAPNYAAARSALAKQSGLGQGGRGVAAAATATAVKKPAKPAVKAARKPKPA